MRTSWPRVALNQVKFVIMESVKESVNVPKTRRSLNGRHSLPARQEGIFGALLANVLRLDRRRLEGEHE